jgi:hypothetical protein
MEVFEKYGKLIIENGFVKEIESDYSGNGYIFKDMENFYNKKGICYVSEYGLEEFEDAIDEGKTLTEQDIINLCFGVDYRSCLDIVDNHLRDYGIRTENAILERIAESILCSCDWQYFDTELVDQYIDDLEEWVKTLEKEIDAKTE